MSNMDVGDVNVDIPTQVMSPTLLPAVSTTPLDAVDQGGEGDFLDGYGSVHANGSPFEEETAVDGYDENIANVARSLFNGAVGPEPTYGGASSSAPPAVAASSDAEKETIGGEEHQLLNLFVKMMKKGSSESSRPTTSLRLAKMPGCGDHVLPSVKEWQMSTSSCGHGQEHKVKASQTPLTRT
jgi:hypothetical protein